MKIIINLSNKCFTSFMEAKNTMKKDKNLKFLFKTHKFNKHNTNFVRFLKYKLYDLRNLSKRIKSTLINHKRQWKQIFSSRKP